MEKAELRQFDTKSEKRCNNSLYVDVKLELFTNFDMEYKDELGELVREAKKPMKSWTSSIVVVKLCSEGR